MSLHSTNDRAGGYYRVSDPTQSSIPDQLAWAHGYASREGYRLVCEFADDGLSGDDLDRPGLDALEEEFRKRHAAGQPIARLIIWEMKRLARSDVLSAFALLDRLRNYGLRYIHTHDRTFDLREALDRTLLSIEQDHKNHAFLKDLAPAVLRGMAAVVKEGYWVGRIPLGYRLERVRGNSTETGDGKTRRRRRSGKLVIDPDTAPLIRELFRIYADGSSTVKLADWLTAQVKPRRAPRWSPQTIRQLLMNEVYIGTVIFGRRAGGKHARLSADGPVLRLPEDDVDNMAGAMVIRNGAPAIVDESIFAIVRERLAQGRRRGRKKGRLPLPLAGLGKCGHCDGPLHAVLADITLAGGEKGKSPRLICARRARYKTAICQDGTTSSPAEPVLRKILNLISAEILSGDLPERVTRDVSRQAREHAERREAERGRIEGRIAELEQASHRAAYRLATVDDDMIGAVKEGIRQVREELKELRGRLSTLDEKAAEAPPLDPEKLRAFFDGCKTAVSICVETPEAGAILNTVLTGVIDGFTLYCRKSPKGRAMAARVDVHLPPWILALAGKVNLTDMHSITISGDL